MNGTTQHHKEGGRPQQQGTRMDRAHHNRGRKENSRSSKGGEAVPTTEELRAVVFAHGSVFRPKEKVIVPRSRGGFTFGYILKPVPRHHCYVDPTAPINANHQEWRVVYKNGKGEDLFKDLPPASIGKRRAPPAPPTAKPVAILARASSASASSASAVPTKPAHGSSSSSGSSSSGGNDDDDDDGEEIVFRGLHERTSPDQPPAAEIPENAKNATVAAPAAAEEPTERRLGGQVLEKDLAAVSFSPINTFRDGEMVVVPRSAGGFTYGTVQARCECLCPLGPPAHKHFGWRVSVDQATPKPNFKDIFSAHLGKVHLAEDAPTPANGVRTSSAANGPPAIRSGNSAPASRRPNKPQAPVSGDRRQGPRGERKKNYEFAEVGDNNSNARPAVVFNQTTADDDDYEYDFRYSASASASSSVPRSLAQQAAQAAGVSPAGAKKHEGDDDDDDDDEADYFEEYDDDDHAKEEQPAPAAAVPTFSGLFGGSGGGAVPAKRREFVSPTPAKPPADSNGVSAPNGAIDTSKKGVLCVQVPAAQSKKKQHQHQQQQRGQWQRNNNNNDHHHQHQHQHQHQYKGRGGQKGKDAHKPKIIIDGPNVAMRHGNNKKVSVKGLKLAIQYWERKGHQVIAFVPQHYLTRKAPTGPELKFSEFMPMADNLGMLQDLVDAGSVVLTPPQDYDDSYCIEYAKNHGSYIVTNDRYWDHVDKQPEAMRARVVRWLREHCISFTFVKDEFLPNPDFAFLPLTMPLPEEEEEKKGEGEAAAPAATTTAGP